MTHFRQFTRSQLPAYQYAYGDKMASGVCLQNTFDYSPFGVALDGRTIENDFYRRGFNGMEKDDEVKGAGNSYTTEYRQYNTRLGRWLSIDPLELKYPWQSPYVAFNNNPILFVDPTGLEGENPHNENELEGIDVKDNITWNYNNHNFSSLSYNNIPTPENLNYTMEQSFREKVLIPLESDNWIREKIENSADPKTIFSQILLGTEIVENQDRVKETRGDESLVYKGRILEVTTQYLDKRMITENNPEGEVPESWNKIYLKDTYFNENFPQVISPDGNSNDPTNTYILNKDRSIKWTVRVVVEPNL